MTTDRFDTESNERIVDADGTNVRIAVVRDHASTLTLSRIFKHAQLICAATPDPTFGFLRNAQADAFASVRSVLPGYAPKLPGSRIWRTSGQLRIDAVPYWPSRCNRF